MFPLWWWGSQSDLSTNGLEYLLPHDLSTNMTACTYVDDARKSRSCTYVRREMDFTETFLHPTDALGRAVLAEARLWAEYALAKEGH